MPYYQEIAQMGCCVELVWTPPASYHGPPPPTEHVWWGVQYGGVQPGHEEFCADTVPYWVGLQYPWWTLLSSTVVTINYRQYPGSDYNVGVGGSYCGPETRACCVDQRCFPFPPMDCWAGGGQTLRTWRSAGLGGYNFDTMSFDWWPTCDTVRCNEIWCCSRRADGSHRCHVTAGEDACISTSWAVESYPIPAGFTCEELCGQGDIACCFADRICRVRSFGQCLFEGGWPGLGTTCTGGACLSPYEPMPCCLCGGKCAMLPPGECAGYGGMTYFGTSCEAALLEACEANDPRPADCRAALFVLVPDEDDPTKYTYLSTAPLDNIEYGAPPQYHRAHSSALEPWMCNRWNAAGDIEYHNCGYALNKDGILGDCVPEGYAGLICDWQPPC